MISKIEENATFWPIFVQSILTNSKYLDYFPDHAFLQTPPERAFIEAILQLDYKQALQKLKPLMLPEYQRRLASKYANYKYNKKNRRSTFSINENTISRLSRLLTLHGLDNYNELIEYLTQPDNASQAILKDFSDENPTSGLSTQDAFKVFVKKLNSEQQSLITNTLKMVYIQACKDNKHNKNQSVEDMQNKMSQYLNELL